MKSSTMAALLLIASSLFRLTAGEALGFDLCGEIARIEKMKETPDGFEEAKTAIRELVGEAQRALSADDLKKAVLKCIEEDERGHRLRILSSFLWEWANAVKKGELAAFQMQCFFAVYRPLRTRDYASEFLPSSASPDSPIPLTDEEIEMLRVPILEKGKNDYLWYAQCLPWFSREAREKLFSIFLQRAIQEIREPTEYMRMNYHGGEGVIFPPRMVSFLFAAYLRQSATAEYPALIRKAPFNLDNPAEREWRLLMLLMAGDPEAAEPALALMSACKPEEYGMDYVPFLYAYVGMLERTLKTPMPIDKLKEINPAFRATVDHVLPELLNGNGVSYMPRGLPYPRLNDFAPPWRLTVEGDMIVPRDPPAAQEGGGAPAAVAGAEASAEAGVGASPVSP